MLNFYIPSITCTIIKIRGNKYNYNLLLYLSNSPKISVFMLTTVNIVDNQVHQLYNTLWLLELSDLIAPTIIEAKNLALFYLSIWVIFFKTIDMGSALIAVAL